MFCQLKNLKVCKNIQKWVWILDSLENGNSWAQIYYPKQDSFFSSIFAIYHHANAISIATHALDNAFTNRPCRLSLEPPFFLVTAPLNYLNAWAISDVS